MKSYYLLSVPTGLTFIKNYKENILSQCLKEGKFVGHIFKKEGEYVTRIFK